MFMQCTFNFRIIQIYSIYHILKLVGWYMVFNATFNNISVISWLSVLLVDGRKPPTCRKSLINLTTYCCIKCTTTWSGFELTKLHGYKIIINKSNHMLKLVYEEPNKNNIMFTLTFLHENNNYLIYSHYTS